MNNNSFLKHCYGDFFCKKNRICVKIYGMANQNKAIGSFDIIRKLVRNLYLEGLNNYIETESLRKSSRAFMNNLNSIKNFLDERFMSSKTNTKKQSNPVISFNTREETENPLYALWKTGNSIATNLSFDFAVMDILEDYPEGVSWFSLTSDSDSNKRDNLLSGYVSKGIDKKSVKAKLEKLADACVIEFFEDGRKIRKADTKAIKRLLSSREARQAIQFASETCPLGVIGSYILDNLKTLNSETLDTPVHYKHHFIFNSIDYEIMYLLLEAISHKEQVEIETERDGLRKIVPLKIFISTQTGRTYVVFWNVQEEIFYSENLEFILSVKNIGKCTDYDGYKEKLSELEPHIWGVSFKKEKDYELEHVRFVIEYPTEKEKGYIPSRIKREAVIGTVKEIDECHSEYTADIIDSNEIVPWIQSFYERITEIDFPHKEKIIEDVELLAEGKIRKAINHSVTIDKPAYELKNEPENTALFSHLYSTYYLVAKKVAEFCILNPCEVLNRDVLDKIIDDTGFVSDKIELYNLIEYTKESKHIFRQKGDKVVTALKHIPDFPLSTIELRFLAAVMQDAKVTMFMDSQTVEKLKAELRDVKPLWSKENVKYFDQNKDSDAFESTEYKERFAALLHAINNNKIVHLVYGKKGNASFTPTHMDYSQKDDTFRLFLKESKYPINLENIKSCNITEEVLSGPEQSTEYETLKIEIYDDTDTKFLFNRAVRQFSYFKKTCRKTEKENIYEMTVDYDESDRNEIVIRTLMFGPNMKVLEPEVVVDEVRKRVEKQRRLFNGD